MSLCDTADAWGETPRSPETNAQTSARIAVSTFSSNAVPQEAYPALPPASLETIWAAVEASREEASRTHRIVLATICAAFAVLLMYTDRLHSQIRTLERRIR